MTPRMDAAVAVDAKNAPTATWKTAQHAVSHSAHTHHLFSGKAKDRRPKAHNVNAVSHTKFLTLPLPRLVKRSLEASTLIA